MPTTIQITSVVLKLHTLTNNTTQQFHFHYSQFVFNLNTEMTTKAYRTLITTMFSDNTFIVQKVLHVSAFP